MSRLAPTLVAIAVAGLFASAPPAPAQQCPLPICDLPEPDPTPTPSATPAPGDEPPAQPPPADPPPGAGEALAYGQDAGHTGAATEESVFGPLRRLWTRRFDGAPNYPLLLGGKVVVGVSLASGSEPARVMALAASTGKTAWSRPIPGGGGSVALAAAGGRVFAGGRSGVVSALSASDGAVLWQRTLEKQGLDHGDVVAGDGYVFVAADDEAGYGRVWALAARDGRTLWSARAPLGSRPAYDGERVYVSDACDLTAYERATGRVAWTHSPPGSDCTDAFVFPVVAGGRVYAGGEAGAMYDAATGRRLPGSAPFGRAGVRGGRLVGYLFPGNRWGALDLAGGAPAWLHREPDDGGALLDPVGPALTRAQTFFVARSISLYALDTATGATQFATRIPNEGTNGYGIPIGGLAAGQGILALTQQSALSAYGPVLQPPERGTDIASSAFAIRAGRRVGLAGGVGRALRDGTRRAMRLESRRSDRRRWRRRARGRTMPDGSWQLERRIVRNTTFRVRTPGASASRPLTVYAYPGLRNRIVAVSPRLLELRQTVRGPRAMPATGRRLVVYLGRRKARRYDRLGSATLRRAGRGRWATRVRFAPPRRVGRRDVLAVCIVGLARAGWGYPNAFERGCGRRRMPY